VKSTLVFGIILEVFKCYIAPGLAQWRSDLVLRNLIITIFGPFVLEMKLTAYRQKCHQRSSSNPTISCWFQALSIYAYHIFSHLCLR
jgi:hypothetical protein